MPHDLTTGRIYRETVGGVTYGIIDPSDVCPILGVSTASVKNLCQSPAINEDALYKPYEHASMPYDDNFLQGGADGMHGYTVPSHLQGASGSILDLSFYNTLWSFNTPVTWGSLLEFENYNHQVKYASDPWGMTVVETDSTIYCSFDWAGPAEFVCPKNMTAFQDCYMGVAIMYGSNSAGRTLRYAACSTDKISEASGALITISKSDYDATISTVGFNLILVPFLTTAYFSPTTYITDLNGGSQYNINYNSKQYVYIDGTEPSAEYISTKIYLNSIDSPYTFSIRVVITNNYSTTQSGALYPVYIAYKEVEAAGYVYRDAMTDEITKSTSSQQFTGLASGASQTFIFSGLDLYKDGTVVRVDACDLATVRMVFPSGTGSNTNYRDVYFTE